MKGKDKKLTGMGGALEASLQRLLRDLDSEVEQEQPDGSVVVVPKYTLLDRLRVYDRALKLEQIKQRITDPEGSFFNDGDGGEDAE